MKHQKTLFPLFVVAATFGFHTLLAADLCVSPTGKGGCATTVGAAVSAASPHDVIRVGKGTYHENVVITKPLSLLGEGSENTIIDATGLLNAITVDGGHDGAHLDGIAHVIISGLTAQNANAQGIVVTNAFDVTISDNHVTGNDRSLNVTMLTCPPLPAYFQGGEGFDCGEGIHLSGVHHSIVTNNLVNHNAGGILISDDTGPNHDNLVSANTVEDNPFDCGITIASHHFVPLGPHAPTDPLLGIYHNTIIGNTSQRNGLATGEGAGVGLFAGPPGAQNNGNVIANNILRDNALPGVALHTHAPDQTLNGHLITGNTISGNGADSDPGTTVPTGISIFSPISVLSGIVISQNTIKGEGIDIGVNAQGSIQAHFNSFFGSKGIDNIGSQAVIEATDNWWKCPGGPGANGCSTLSGNNVTTYPWLVKPF
ncbi:MAG: right-handed parallel beta-helix repeat-containing protein [Bryobacteraceae bacterium]